MTTLLLSLAMIGLALAAFNFVGLPYLLTGGHVFDRFRERGTHKAMGGMLAAAISLVWVLQANPALISDVMGVQVSTDDIMGCGWQV